MPIVLPDRRLLRARCAMLQHTADERERRNGSELLLSGLGMLLPGFAVLQRHMLPEWLMLSGRPVLREKRRQMSRC